MTEIRRSHGWTRAHSEDAHSSGDEAVRAMPAISLPPFPTELKRPESRRNMQQAVILSVFLHGLLLGLFLLAYAFEADPTEKRLAMTLDLVELGASTTSPEADRRGAVPQQRAKEMATHPQDDAIPNAGASTAAAFTSGAPRQTPTKETETASLASRKAPKPEPVKPTIVESDPLSMRLQALAGLVEPSVATPPRPDNQDGTGLSNTTAATADGARGLTATYSVRDFIRAQVMRRWYIGNEAATRHGWSVTIHIRLRPDGSVALAEVVDIAHYRKNRAYFEFALSARNAVELSSPLSIPSGSYEIAKDVTVEFDARRVQ